MTVPPLPFAMARAAFPCPALLQAAAAAPLGGAREALVATIVAIRLAAAMLGAGAVSPAHRSLRADAARAWGSALPLSPRLRTAVERAFAASTGADPAVAAGALEALFEILAPPLPQPARRECLGLVQRLRTAAARLPELDADR